MRIKKNLGLFYKFFKIQRKIAFLVQSFNLFNNEKIYFSKFISFLF